MESPYCIDRDQREMLAEKVLAFLNDESVSKPLRTKLEEFCQTAVDATTDYLKGEYALVLEELVQERAKRLVVALLKGDMETAQSLGLVASEIGFGPDAGKPFVYDPDGIRKAVCEKFKDQIAHAELISLQEQNAELSKELKWYRDREYRSY